MKQITSVGEFGARVAILQRTPKGTYTLRWRDRMTGKPRYQPTSFRVLTKAKDAAKEIADQLYAAMKSVPEDDSMTWQGLFKHYEAKYLELQRGKRQYKVDLWCLALWRAVLPPTQAVHATEKHQLLDFINRRMEGVLEVPGRALRPCAARAPAADLQWLRRVLNIAVADGCKITSNPVRLITIPKTARANAPDAEWPRFEQLRPHCEGVGSQDLFGGFMDLVVGLGWRVTAISCLHVSDIDRKVRDKAPNGRILKRWEFDKQGYQHYVPISDWLAPKLDDLLKRRKRLKVQSPWLFPRVSNPSQPWDRGYAKYRLQVAERKAELDRIEGGDFHPYRRMWSNLRKHLPLKDVAYAGCWDEQTLLRHYMRTDSDTVLRVMNAGLPGATT